MTNMKIIALLALLVILPPALNAQNPKSPSALPQLADAASQPASSISMPADPATKEILATIQGYGEKLDVPVLRATSGRYRVEIGDQVNVLFTFMRALDETVTVLPDGHISLIGASDIKVQGLTLPELNDAIRKAYAGILTTPVFVIATITNMEKPYFVVGGQVTNPGKFILHGSFTVAESIEAAGGFLLNTAKHSQVLLFRRTSDDWVQCRMINLKRVLDRGELENDVQLQSGDLVYVPKNRLSKIQPFISYFVVYNIFNINYGTNYRIAGD
jgi:polysaccharide biosynthesis/export protein